MKKGFTLVETLLYLAILSLVVIALSSFMFLSYTSRIKSAVIAEVEQQGSQTMNLISQTIRNSAAISQPSSGSSASSLNLTQYNGTLSPTIFSQFGSTLQITEGASSAVGITSNRVVVSNLSFQNLSRPNTPGIIQVKFTLTHVNPDNRGEYNYSKNFTATTALRYP
jgi:type II secretory pathway pseudopilin PulG